MSGPFGGLAKRKSIETCMSVVFITFNLVVMYIRETVSLTFEVHRFLRTKPLQSVDEMKNP